MKNNMREIIEPTAGQYGNEKLKAYFRAGKEQREWKQLNHILD